MTSPRSLVLKITLPVLCLLFTLLLVGACSPGEPAPQPPETLLVTPRPWSVFGAEIEPHNRTGVQTRQAGYAGTSPVRFNGYALNVALTETVGVYWSEIQPNPPQNVQNLLDPANFDWGVLAEEEAKLRAMREAGLTPIVVVRGVPEWARAHFPGSAYPTGRPCGQIDESRVLTDSDKTTMDAFVAFMEALATRYGPTNGEGVTIDYWELWNEPDAAFTHVAVDHGRFYGCWADRRTDEFGRLLDPYVGGESFGRMLSRVAPVIRRANPSARIVLGGLMMDSGANATGGAVSVEFLEGVLRTGATSFDILAFHSYPYWGWHPASGEKFDWDVGVITGTHYAAGGLTLSKLEHIRTLLARYNVANKPIILNEVGLLCAEYATDARNPADPADDVRFPLCPTPNAIPADFSNDKANYVLRSHIRLWGHGVAALFWRLGISTWYHIGLEDQAGDLIEFAPLTTYRTLAVTLQGATFAGRLFDGTPRQGIVEGYRFCRGNDEVRVYWTNLESQTGQVAVADLPGEVRAARDKLGRLHSVVSGTLPIGFEPLIVELALPAPCQESALWNFDTAQASRPMPENGTALSSLGRYHDPDGDPSTPNGPCAGRPAGTCAFDTRHIAGTIEWITAYGHYWAIDLSTNAIASGDLTDIERYRAGPCQGLAAGTCRFDTHLIADGIEQITAYGKLWTFDLATNALLSQEELTSIAGYAVGPCRGRAVGTCAFDTRTLLGNSESITAYGQFWTIEGGTVVSSGDLTSIDRYANGPCFGRAPGTCRFGTRTMLGSYESITQGTSAP